VTGEGKWITIIWNIASPAGTVEQIMKTLTTMNTSSNFPVANAEHGHLVQRLRQVAQKHHGLIPLHGRLFAQWLHHAYPHQCPFPYTGHAIGNTSESRFSHPEWIMEGGDETSVLSDEEITCFVDGPCRLGSGSAYTDESGEVQIPWIDAEELLAQEQFKELDMLSHLMRFNNLLRLALAYVLLISLGMMSKCPQANIRKITKQGSVMDRLALALFMSPLLITTVDMAVDLPAQHEYIMYCRLAYGGDVLPRFRESFTRIRN